MIILYKNRLVLIGEEAVMAKKYKLKPYAYVVLGVLLLVIILCIYGLVQALKGDDMPVIDPLEPSATPEIVQNTMTPVPEITPTPELIIVTQAPTETPLIVVDAPTPTAKPKATPRVATSSEKKNAKTGTLTGNGVNLRSGPSTEYERVGSYDKGATMAVYAKDGDFYFVKMDKDGKTGFMSKKYVTVSDSSASSTAKPTPTPNVPKGAVSGKVTAKTVAIRQKADKSSKALGEVKSGDIVYVFYKEGEFYNIETTSGKKGFCYASYVKPSAAVPTK